MKTVDVAFENHELLYQTFQGIPQSSQIQSNKKHTQSFSVLVY